MKISLIILTRNEIEGLRAVGNRIPKDAVDEIIAVDYESKDGTAEYLNELGFRVIAQKTPGRGEAFRLAIKEATGDAFVFFSPDGNEDPADIPKFRAYFDGGKDIVIGTRMVKGAKNEEDGQVIRLRKWVNLAFTLIANTLWNRSGRYVTDTINGFRGITREAWDALALDGHGYTIEYQMSIRGFKLRKKFGEFPTHEGERIGAGGSPALKTGIVFIQLLLKEFFKSVRLVLRKGLFYTPRSSAEL